MRPIALFLLIAVVLAAGWLLLNSIGTAHATPPDPCIAGW
jgi:hypothetical protein